MKVKIKDLEYVIVEETDGDNVFCDKIIDGQSKMRLGSTDYQKQKIYLHEHMTRTRKRKVLAHELTHAFVEAYGSIKNHLMKNNCVSLWRIIQKK